MKTFWNHFQFTELKKDSGFAKVWDIFTKIMIESMIKSLYLLQMEVECFEDVEIFCKKFHFSPKKNIFHQKKTKPLGKKMFTST